MMTCPRCRSRLGPQRGEPECLNCGTITMRVAVLELPRRADYLDVTWPDDGCELNPSCFSCPFPECRQNGKASAGVMPLFDLGD